MVMQIEGITLTPLLNIAVPGQLPRKSNSRRLVTKGRKPMVIKSKKALEYTDHFLESVKDIAESLDRPFGSRNELLSIVGVIYYPSYRSDLSIELLTDLLQKANIISDDRWIRLHVVWAVIDKENPRVDVTIYEIGGDTEQILFRET